MHTQIFEAVTSQFSELSTDEMMDTQGGESAWYWIAYGIGSWYNAVSNTTVEYAASPAAGW